MGNSKKHRMKLPWYFFYTTSYFKCLGNLENFKVENFDEIRENLLKRENEIHSCSKCLKNENMNSLQDCNEDYFLFDSIDEQIDIYELMKTNPSYCEKTVRSRILEILQKKELKMSHDLNLADWNKETNLTKLNIEANIKLVQAQNTTKFRLNKVMRSLGR